jgi:hypothetical protein
MGQSKKFDSCLAGDLRDSTINVDVSNSVVRLPALSRSQAQVLRLTKSCQIHRRR